MDITNKIKCYGQSPKFVIPDASKSPKFVIPVS